MNITRNPHRCLCYRAILLAALVAILTTASSRLQAQSMGMCGEASITIPFTDVPNTNIFFCAIASAYFTGLTNGTSATTYSPSTDVTREQMAAFVTRTLDQSLRRGSRRAALDQWWTTQAAGNLGLTTVGNNPQGVKSDGLDVWAVNGASGTVSRVQASDGFLLDTWNGAVSGSGVLVAMGKVFVTGATSPNGTLYQIDPTQPAGPVTILTSGLGGTPQGIAYDGTRIWTANQGGSVSRVTLNPTTVNTVPTGFNSLVGILYDGANIWVTDTGDDTLKRLDTGGAILQPVSVGSDPAFPAFDGANIWVPNLNSNSVTVVRATGTLAGTVLATLNGNGLNNPFAAAFDGERILVTNFSGASVSLWKASDLTPIGTFPTGANTSPRGACSDGVNFWIALDIAGASDRLARF